MLSGEAKRAERYRSRMKNAAAMQVVKAGNRDLMQEKKGEENIVENNKIMNLKMSGRKKMDVLRLHLELDMQYTDEEEMEILKKYGAVDQTISRDILVPGDITLHALNYAILRMFGWQNGHLHNFSLPDDVFKQLTNNDFMTLSKMAGASASIAVDMFLSEDKTQTASLARKLCDINRDRQAEENKIAESASEKIEESYDLSDCPMIILDDEKWHHGIIGIVSSRITEKYQLPSILISFEGNKGEISDEDIGKGSGRSVKGLNLVEALSSCRDILEKFGGHELAAGLTVKRKNLPELRRRLEAYARAYINSDTAENVLSADAELLPEDVTLEQAEQFSQLEPYGPGNTMPLLVIRDLTVSDIVSVGEGKHTKLTLDCGGRPVTAMCFRSTLEELDIYPGDHVDVAFNIDVNEYQNTKSVQMIVREISSSETVLRKRSGERERLRHITETVRAGEKTEDVTIDRKDVAAVYTMIKNELKMHHEVFSIHALLHLSSANRIDTDYIRMSLILRIFFELGFLGIKMPADSREIYRFSSELPDRKTSLEKSEIYRAVSHD